MNIRPSAYESLSLVELLPTTGIRLENGANNALTLIIPKNTAAGDYTATAKFELVQALLRQKILRQRLLQLLPNLSLLLYSPTLMLLKLLFWLKVVLS